MTMEVFFGEVGGANSRNYKWKEFRLSIKVSYRQKEQDSKIPV